MTDEVAKEHFVQHDNILTDSHVRQASRASQNEIRYRVNNNRSATLAQVRSHISQKIRVIWLETNVDIISADIQKKFDDLCM